MTAAIHLARANSDDPVPIIFASVVLAIFLILGLFYVGARLNAKFGKNKSFQERFRRFFGRHYDQLQTHDKKFPGYDLASLHRAIESYQKECCATVMEIGGCIQPTLRDLFDILKSNKANLSRPHTARHLRIPVDLGEEASFASNMMWFATITSGVDAATENCKIAMLLSTTTVGIEHADDFEGSRSTQQLLMLSIACSSRAIADRFFSEIDRRRRELSIYRGKVIDPDVSAGGIHSIGFRSIKRVDADSLVLPEEVTQLIRSAIVGFYDHVQTLRAVGVEMKRGVLFHSPPGTGKTSISLYLAGLLPNFTVCFVSGQRLLYPREICRMARYLQPAMIVFEDIDLVAEERDSNGLATVLGELMNQIDGCEPDEQVLFVMNTNSLERLESAVRNRPGRVDQIIAIPLPDVDARRRLIRQFAAAVKLSPESDLQKVLRATDGLTPATLKEVVKRATVSAIERTGGNGQTDIELTQQDLLLATAQVQAMRQPGPASSKMGFA
jgi:hypothetical protein